MLTSLAACTSGSGQTFDDLDSVGLTDGALVVGAAVSAPAGSVSVDEAMFPSGFFDNLGDGQAVQTARVRRIARGFWVLERRGPTHNMCRVEYNQLVRRGNEVLVERDVHACAGVSCSECDIEIGPSGPQCVCLVGAYTDGGPNAPQDAEPPAVGGGMCVHSRQDNGSGRRPVLATVAALVDAGPDSGPPDSGPPDSGPPDSGPPDSGL